MLSKSFFFWSTAKPRVSRVQQRILSSQITNFQPQIEESYNTLINHPFDGSPLTCNFVSQVVEKWAKVPNNLAIRCLDQDNKESEDITYLDIVTRGNQIASFFEKDGIKKGEPVALILGQHPAWWYSLAGLMRKGIPIVPCPRLLTPKDLIYRINDLNIKGIITTPELQDKIDSIQNHCPSLKSFVTTGEATSNWISLNETYKSNPIPLSQMNTTTKDPCLYLYTSGTTGQPKAVIHNHDYPFFHWPTGKRWLRATPEDLVYNASDTGWGFTVWTTTAVWAMGAKLLITPTNKKFAAQKILTILSNEGVTIFCAAPTVLRLLVSDKHFDSYTFPHLKRIVTVGEALDETVISRFHSRGIEVHVGFGQAETPLLMGRLDDQAHMAGTMNKPVDPYRIVILDDSLQPLPPGNIGQIAVDLINGKRNGLMRGYANSPEKTQETFSSDRRYYLTGDWAKYRNDGYFSYEGRRDDLIKSRGYRIGPDEVEKAGMSHPAVAKIAVVGVRTEQETLGRTVKAFILLKPNYVESPELIENIQEHIKRETAPHMYPRLVECLKREEWEKYETISGKIRRVALREREENKLLEYSLDRSNQMSRI